VSPVRDTRYAVSRMFADAETTCATCRLARTATQQQQVDQSAVEEKSQSYRPKRYELLTFNYHRPTLLPCKKVKGKVFPYSLPSVGPGADPGVQAVSPQVT